MSHVPSSILAHNLNLHQRLATSQDQTPISCTCTISYGELKNWIYINFWSDTSTYKSKPNRSIATKSILLVESCTGTRILASTDSSLPSSSLTRNEKFRSTLSRNLTCGSLCVSVWEMVETIDGRQWPAGWGFGAVVFHFNAHTLRDSNRQMRSKRTIKMNFEHETFKRLERN